MKIARYTHPEYGEKQYYEITYLDKGEAREWFIREDGRPRYGSYGLGAVIIWNSNGGWYWNEYDRDDPRVGKTVAELEKKGWKPEEVDLATVKNLRIKS